MGDLLFIKNLIFAPSYRRIPVSIAFWRLLAFVWATPFVNNNAWQVLLLWRSTPQAGGGLFYSFLFFSKTPDAGWELFICKT